MDQVLVKFGMSEARRSIRNLTKRQMMTTPKKIGGRNHTAFMVSSFQHSENSKQAIIQSSTKREREERQKNKLEKMKDFLKASIQKRCPVKEHEYNRVKYLCLEESCSNNFGCSHCFLHYHRGHEKAEVEICIRDIEDLNSLMNSSYKKITCDKYEMRNQILKQIDIEINNLCDDFHSNLQFLKNKAIKQIDDYFIKASSSMTYLTEEEQHQSPNLEELTLEIIKLDIKGIERDLYRQLQGLEYEKMNTLPIIKFFQEMNGSMGHFMAEFKKSFPKIYPIIYDKEQALPVKRSRRREEQPSNFTNQQSNRNSPKKYFQGVQIESPHFQN